MLQALRFLFIFALALFLIACGGDDDKKKSVYEAAAEDEELATLVTVLELTGLDETLDDLNNTYTLFAPTDAAFSLLGEEVIDEWLNDPDTLSDILLYHVVAGAEVDQAAALAAAGTTVEMANGDNVGVSFVRDELKVNLSIVSRADIQADNGVIHVIDAVLVPPTDMGTPTNNIVETAVAAGSFTTLVAALEATDLDVVLADESSTFTVFAPTDAAFDALGADNVANLLGDTETLSSILLQHVVSGSVNAVTAYSLNGDNAITASTAEIPVDITGTKLRFGGAEVEVTDIYTTNGVIHVIDTVVVADVALPKPAQNIAEVATVAGSFTTLIAALEATGLDAVVADESGAFTVFAPTDDAFAELGVETINALLADTDTLSDILLYHVVSDSEVLADTARRVASLPNSFVSAANMDSLALSLGSDDELLINLSEVVTANVMASNGVIHVIDKVLIPPSESNGPTLNIVETASAAGSFTTLITALEAAGLDSTLADEDETFTVFAPTDEAFELLEDGVLDALLSDVDALSDVLLQHVIVGQAVDSLTAFSLNGMSVDTAAGEDVTIEIDDGQLLIQGSPVSMFDIYTTNGVIYVIDAVITETVSF